MADEFIAKARVVPAPGQENQVAARMPKDLTEEDLHKIANVINRSVEVLQQHLKPTGEAAGGDQLSLSEVEMTFGIDLEGEAKIPLIGPLFQVGFKAGATFQVVIKLSR